MLKIARIPSAALLLSAALFSGCADSPTAPSELVTSGSLAAKGANVGVLSGSWTGTIAGNLATLTVLQSGSRVTGTLIVASASGDIPYAVEGLENKGKVYLNLFDGTSLPQPIIGTVTVGVLTGTLNGLDVVSLAKRP